MTREQRNEHEVLMLEGIQNICTSIEMGFRRLREDDYLDGDQGAIDRIADLMIDNNEKIVDAVNELKESIDELTKMVGYLVP